MADREERGLGIKSFEALNATTEFRTQYHPLTTFSPGKFPHVESQNIELESPGTPSVQNHRCGRREPYRSLEWIAVISLFFVGLYSTLLSGVWLAIAIANPIWDDIIHFNSSKITPVNASTVTTALAKTIEMSFITLFLAVIGQYLTCKASNNNTAGISLAELQLKIVLLQPGVLVTRWTSYSRSMLSVLGIVSLVACLSATFYTTASDALGKNFI